LEAVRVRAPPVHTAAWSRGPPRWAWACAWAAMSARHGVT